MDQEFSNFKQSLEYMNLTELTFNEFKLIEEITFLNSKLEAVKEKLDSFKPKNVELGVSSVESEEVVKYG